MREAQFFDWLRARRWKGKPLTNTAIANRLSRLRRVERSLRDLGLPADDLDALYDSGGWPELLERLRALIAEGVRPPKPLVPLAANPEAQLRNLLAVARHYGNFRAGTGPDSDALDGLRSAFLDRIPGFVDFEQRKGPYWEIERRYKEEIIRKAQAIASSDVPAVEAGKALYGAMAPSAGPLLRWQTEDAMRKRHPDLAAGFYSAIAHLARTRDGPVDAIVEAAESLQALRDEGATILTFGQIAAIVFTTLGCVRPTESAPFKTLMAQDLTNLLTGRVRLAGPNLDAEEVHDWLSLLSEIRERLDQWGWRPRDLFDVQGFLWVALDDQWLPGSEDGEDLEGEPEGGEDTGNEPEDREDPDDPEGEDAPREIDARIPFVLDTPADSEDELDRGPFALFLAQRLHLIWCQLNGNAPDGRGGRTVPAAADADTFIVHVDSPWGGGKTTFANFVARVLDPRGQTMGPQHFLRSSLAPTMADEELAKIELDEIFVPPFARTDTKKWADARRPWIVVRYNAWRDQYVQPPWWQVFLSIQAAVSREVRRDTFDPSNRSLRSIAGGTWRWGTSVFERFAYQIWNRKLQGQLLLWSLVGLLYLLVWALGLIDGVLGAGGAGKGETPVDARRTGDWIALGILVVGVSGASIATLFTIVSQSLAPDLDFTAEHKQIGVRDPISRFRRSFNRILRATPRPVLLIVDDLDRCEPKTVVELLRGFQTIMRSPRLFVLLLGDRAWIENAHDVYHKELGGAREGEGGLGARFVQKVIQLSFRLPIMKPAARSRFARKVLGDGAGDPAAAKVIDILRDVDARVSGIVGQSGAIGGKEARVARVLKEARAALPAGLSEAETEQAVDLADRLVSVRMVASAGADAAQQRSVFNAVTRLIDSLPNNPRQIKRIFMAFATYEVVGRVYFGYQLTPEGPDGERRARRWRQLAIWVTLAIEWPETWRALARRPEMLDIAYADTEGSELAAAEFLADCPEAERADAAATLRKLRSDRALRALLSRDSSTAPSNPDDPFPETSMDVEAVYEFNRIIWEPGFRIDPEI